MYETTIQVVIPLREPKTRMRALYLGDYAS